MTKNKPREEVLLERFRRAGLASDVTHHDAPFVFVISPTTTPGVDRTEISWFAREFKIEVLRKIQDRRMITDLTGIVLFPTIMDPDIAKFPEGITYKRKEKSYFVKRNIPFAIWKSASSETRLDLFADNLRDSIRSIPDRRLCGTDKAILLSAVDEAGHALKLR
jgi:hypothetical protein